MRVEPHPCVQCHTERGSALLVVLACLGLLAIFGLFLSLNAGTGVRIGDNFEAEVRARQAALAGISHSRAALRGVSFDEVLRGPDGSADMSTAYLNLARHIRFRSFLSFLQARTVDLEDPAADVEGIPDDGIIHSRSGTGMAIVAVVPATGLPVPSPPGATVAARYFVKVVDNSGDASEVAADPSDNPFTDGDSTVIVRSTGVARALREDTSTGIRRNAVVVIEARLRRRSTFELEAPLVLQGDGVRPAGPAVFNGSAFLLDGGASSAGIATIDVDSADERSPLADVLAALTPEQAERILGGGTTGPSVRDLTSAVGANPEKRMRMERTRLQWFVRQIPAFADATYSGDVLIAGGENSEFGSYDPSLPLSDSAQRPRVTLVNGDLTILGDLAGAGLLVVTGRLAVTGRLSYYGMVMVVGAGSLNLSGPGSMVRGAVLATALVDSGGSSAWGTVALTLGGMTTLTYDTAAVRLAIALIPPSQTGIREVVPAMDP